MAAAVSHRILICSVGYGQGHHAAAEALAEELRAGGAFCRVCDPCALASPRIFAITQAFYRFCVHRMPWLWRVTYAQTDTANWRKAVNMPVLRKVKERMFRLLQEEQPDLIICTYPLYAYMLDALYAEGRFHGRYAMVVTDALEISRPWSQSEAPLVFVTDRVSAELVKMQFGLPDSRVIPAGFPVRRAFRPNPILPHPSEDFLRIVFGAYRPTSVIVHSVRALLNRFPRARITLLAGARTERCRRLLSAELSAGQVEIAAATQRMAELLQSAHFYIGKAGAATMFECYASRVPLLVNFALPGQEQGNLELLLHDGAGYHAETPNALVECVEASIRHGAAGWQRMRTKMSAAGYSGAAARIAAELERRFFS